VTMPLAVVGVSHATAPVEIRERLAFGPAEAERALVALRKECGVNEAVLLSTCNRTEVYLFPARGQRSIDAVERMLAPKAGAIEGHLRDYLFHEWGDSAVHHLFQVSSGLDSMVTGEAEIQGQVREAYRRAAELPVAPPMAGPVLNRLFQMALSVGGRVRSETSIGEGSASVASVAVELARKIFGSLKGKRVLILGAGTTGELIVSALAREGVEGVVVANRTYDRAVDLARRHRGLAVPFDRIREAIPTVDIVLCSTAAPHPVLTRSIVRESFSEPRRHPLLIIDIAVPRDVDPAVGDEPEVFLYNVDDLRKIVDEHVRVREGALPDAQHIIRTHSEEFQAWYASLEVVPVIREMRRQAVAVREAELERLFRGMTHLDPRDRERVEEFAQRLQNKLLHDPTAQLRKGMASGGGAELVEAVRFLYGIRDAAADATPEQAPHVDLEEEENGE
jgi:glutamyl-tRNA reductase